MEFQKDGAAWLNHLIAGFVAGPDNVLGGPLGAEPAWADPLVGYANGADPLWSLYKTVVGPFHWTPKEVFDLAFPEADALADTLTVICWILPQTSATKAANRLQTRFPAEHWSRSRIFGEQFNNKLRQHVVAELADAGYLAVSPMLHPAWQSVNSANYGFASTWSERHAAYAAGLGTFGLCDGLITPLGKAMRVGTVVARLPIAPAARPYSNHHAYCLFHTQGTCGRCIERCPAGALSAQGHDKLACQAYLEHVTKPYVTAVHGFDGYGCGLCQTGVPCESGIPAVGQA
jgi:epoxyqueuosine reductase QueG